MKRLAKSEKNFLRCRPGFTLVELLIVIIIIGILSGMMMLNAGSATDKAEATKIVANMRSVKSACMLFYAENGVWPDTDLSGKSLDTEMSSLSSSDYNSVADFLDSEPDEKYTLNVTDEGYIDVVFDPDNETDSPSVGSGVTDKLADMAQDSGLYANAYGESDNSALYEGSGPIYIRVKK